MSEQEKSNLQSFELFGESSREEQCKQCKDCMFRDNGDVWSNHYEKSSCMIYQYPNIKPSFVRNNTGRCEYYNKETESSD